MSKLEEEDIRGDGMLLVSWDNFKLLQGWETDGCQYRFQLGLGIDEVLSNNEILVWTLGHSPRVIKLTAEDMGLDQWDMV